MPKELRIGYYTVYFWSNDSNPLGPVHVHIPSVELFPIEKMDNIPKGNAALQNKIVTIKRKKYEENPETM